MKDQSKIYPLTEGQLALWTGERLHADVPLHNTAYAFDIHGPVHPTTFRKAFRKLVTDIDALRMVFEEREGVPYQRLRPTIDQDLEVVEWEGDPSEEAIRDWLQTRAKRPLPIGLCAFDSVLLHIDDHRAIWLLNMHHLVTDAVSMLLVYKHMAALYAAESHQSQQEISPPPSFTDYLETKEKSRKQTERDVDYWEGQVQSLTSVPRFYGRRPKSETTESKRIRIPLGSERSKRLDDLVTRPGIRSLTKDLGIFNVLASLLFVYLYRTSGQGRLALGIPSHNRVDRTIKETVGYFVEVFPLVAELGGNDRFYDVLKRVQLATNAYLQHARPGLTVPKISRSFNAVLNYLHIGFPDFNEWPTHSEWLDTGHSDTTHHLRCHILDFDRKGEWELLFDLNLGIFDTNLLSLVPQHFLNLFDAFTSDLDTPIGKPAMANPSERDAVIAISQGPNVDFESLLGQFAQQVNDRPDAVAIRYREETISYAELDRRSDFLARILQQRGVGDPVALYLERKPGYVIALLALLKLGVPYVPIASNQPYQRILMILEDAQVQLVLSQKRLMENVDLDAGVEFLDLEDAMDAIERDEKYDFESAKMDANRTAYMLYTSGSTGKPKGVNISYAALSNYIAWAASYYHSSGQGFTLPLFTSIGFDLTITATFLPLITGGEVVVYKEPAHGPDVSLLDVLKDNGVTGIKLTPAHLALIQDIDLSGSRIESMIVGGEQFNTALAQGIMDRFDGRLHLYNEYGPTEATVGCVVHQYEAADQNTTAVPIGLPIANMASYVLDDYGNPVPQGIVGELYLAGIGLAKGYNNLPGPTREKFVDSPFKKGEVLYRSGDLARLNQQGHFEFVARRDDQLQLNGFRIETADIESNLLAHPQISDAAVILLESETEVDSEKVVNCKECGLPSNYPGSDFDSDGVCHLCKAFKAYEDRAQRYFKTEGELKRVLTSKRGQGPDYDCLSLLSGGKDSTYVLARLVNMGLRVLAFTLDNGYISDQAKENIRTIVTNLGVDHIYGSTEHMNEIFVDSLHRHDNVCNGCFKTIYTLSTQIALSKKIPFVVTGLSRGQFFETRLTEELFWDDIGDANSIDETILAARKRYHKENDAVKKLLDVSAFQNEATFDKVAYIDFYRYCDVRLEDMLRYLKEHVGWKRPTDTGRSTNCLINQLGIYVHKKNRGYSNYSFPYSWDVRLGHKTRQETLEEINEVIDETEVKRIMEEIGYDETRDREAGRSRLVAYYSGPRPLESGEVSQFLKGRLPDYMLPTHFKFVDKLPLTDHGKVDKAALKAINASQLEMDVPFVAPQGEIEELIAAVWKEVLQLGSVGVHDDFIALGGHSLSAIRITARINEEAELDLPLGKVFEFPTISEYADYMERTLEILLQENE